MKINICSSGSSSIHPVAPRRIMSSGKNVSESQISLKNSYCHMVTWSVSYTEGDLWFLLYLNLPFDGISGVLVEEVLM